MKGSQNRQLRIRSCRPTDAAAVLALWKRAEAIPSVTDNVAAVRRRLRRDRQLFLLAWDGPQLVGSIIGGWEGWRASIARLAIAPGYRRRGLAKLLVARIERRLRALGATRVRCVVLRKNAKARAFWNAASYQLSRTEVTFVKDLR
jgi:ribosomal protein S18 acetylase RimI-like enzyme